MATDGWNSWVSCQLMGNRSLPSAFMECRESCFSGYTSLPGLAQRCMPPRRSEQNTMRPLGRQARIEIVVGAERQLGKPRAVHPRPGTNGNTSNRARFRVPRTRPAPGRRSPLKAKSTDFPSCDNAGETYAPAGKVRPRNGPFSATASRSKLTIARSGRLEIPDDVQPAALQAVEAVIGADHVVAVLGRAVVDSAGDEEDIAEIQAGVAEG